MSRAFLTPLRQIKSDKGDVRHALKRSDPGFAGFGEAYFSTVAVNEVKGWKRHNRMTLNLVVVCGEVRFMVHDAATQELQAFQLTPDRADAYSRLTVPPGLWVAFGGVQSSLNMLLNIADLAHDPAEADSQPLDAIPWNWS